nr:hypothetical protein [Dyadobacter sp.]
MPRLLSAFYCVTALAEALQVFGVEGSASNLQRDNMINLNGLYQTPFSVANLTIWKVPQLLRPYPVAPLSAIAYFSYLGGGSWGESN